MTVVATLAVTGDDDGAPDDWDPRVVDLVAEIEEYRELDFTSPVRVTFLGEDDFVERVTSENDDLTDDELEQVERSEEMLRALGLVEGDVDFNEESDQLAADGVLGFYDPTTTELVVRGTPDELDPMVSATVVHELTHALQDQHFDLDTPLESEAAGESTAGRALIEADANYVEQRWVANLSTEEREEYERLLREFVAAGDDDGAPPAVLEESLSFPYVFGPVLHAVLRDEGGLDAVDDAFGRYPVSEEQILFPPAYLESDEPTPVDVPSDADGDVVDEGDFGAFGVFQVLSRRLDYEPSLAAVEGWGGDAYRLVDRDGTRCVDLAVAADTEDDFDELVGAFRQWVDGVDGAAVDVHDDVMVLSSCDPGDALPPSPHRTETGAAFDALAFRAAIQDEVMTVAGLDLETATCVGDRFVAEVGVDRLGEINDTMSEDPDAELPAAAIEAVSAAMADC